MRVQQPVRDRNTSLWQSAVRQTLLNRGDLSAVDKKQVEYGVSLHAKSVESGKPLSGPVATSAAAAGSKVGPPANIAIASKAALDALQAHHSDDSAASGSLLSTLHDFVEQYSSWDIAGWAQCGWYYIKYYVIAHLAPTYRNWHGYLSNDPGFGVIKYRLPSQCRVLMIGDWGTHMPDNVALLRQAVTKFKPDAIIHLGDVYYSGTLEECTQNVLNVMDQIYSNPVLAPRPPFFTIPGNHDYYSGGGGFYHTIDTINSGITDCTQQASYFCLRTKDDKWQFLAMDTGYEDRVPAGQLSDPQGPDLHQDEYEWHKDKLENFAGSTILLSHHQLLSANQQLSRGARPYLNDKLYNKFSPYFDRISAWYWGHEHNLILFENNMAIDNSGPPLKKGRLLGCSAYEEAGDQDPYAINYPAAKFMDKPRLGLSIYKTDLQSFYNHAFAILDIAPDKITASYYQYPSWGDATTAPTSDPPIGAPLHQEQLEPMR